jgi:hypothetical protein
MNQVSKLCVAKSRRVHWRSTLTIACF